jgi:hypothetical protein
LLPSSPHGLLRVGTKLCETELFNLRIALNIALELNKASFKLCGKEFQLQTVNSFQKIPHTLGRVVENAESNSRTQAGWILSLSEWESECQNELQNLLRISECPNNVSQGKTF